MMKKLNKTSKEQQKLSSLIIGVVLILFGIWDFSNPDLRWLGWIMLIAGIIIILGNTIRPQKRK